MQFGKKSIFVDIFFFVVVVVVLVLGCGPFIFVGDPKNGPLPQDPVVKNQAFETWTWHQPMGDVEDMEWTACDLSIGVGPKNSSLATFQHGG